MSKLEITPEILSKASECETAEEIQNKAKEFGKDISKHSVYLICHTQAVQ